MPRCFYIRKLRSLKVSKNILLFLSLSILQKRAVHSAYCQLSKALHFFEEFIRSKILQAFKCGLVSESPALKKNVQNRYPQLFEATDFLHLF